MSTDPFELRGEPSLAADGLELTVGVSTWGGGSKGEINIIANCTSITEFRVHIGHLKSQLDLIESAAEIRFEDAKRRGRGPIEFN